MCLLAILCFVFPEYLTTPEFRSSYPIELFRNLIRISMYVSAVIASFSVLTRTLTRHGFLIFTLLALCLMLGGAEVVLKTEFNDAVVQVGLDWLVLNLFVLALIFVPLESLFPLKVHQHGINRKGFGVDLTYFAVGHLGVQILALLSQQPVEFWVNKYNLNLTGGLLSQQNLVAQVFIALLVSDLAQYWIHRAFHEIPVLWRFHKAHHSIKKLDWLAGSRLHLVDIIFVRGFVYFFVLMLGLDYKAFVIYIVIVATHAVLNHTNIRMNLGILEYLIASNRFHHWHHHDRPIAYDKNYAVHFPFIDKLFGTYYLPKGEWPDAYGITEENYPEDYIGQFLHPFSSK
ncbi:MAG: sterol desaturase family protein [Gammaproteobacteria bacterium]|nr:sterol desaturase family protein [Gammaproteobacteria bacterium]